MAAARPVRTTPPKAQARTRLARAAVVDAARHLFVERGYGATTVEAISEQAEVPVATVYRLFSSKHGILQALFDVSIGGDDDDVPMAARPEVQALLASDDARRQLTGLARIVVAVNGRIAPLYRALVTAAGVDPEAAALLATLNDQRQDGQRAFARSLARRRALRPPLRERDAADVIHALMSPELYQLLVVDRGWTPARYEAWLTETLSHQLLPAPDPHEPGRPNDLDAGPRSLPL